jgi:hypothetical protein
MITGGYTWYRGNFSTFMPGKQFIYLKRFDLDEQKIPKRFFIFLDRNLFFEKSFFLGKISAYLKILIICAELAKALWY